MTAEALLQSAVQLNFTNKVWIADEGWALSNFSKEKRFKTTGTVIGVSQPVVTIPGLSDFIHSAKTQTHCEIPEENMLCNQVCTCSGLSPEEARSRSLP